MTQEERAALVEALRNTGLQSAAIAADQIEADGETIALQKTTIQNLIDAGDGLCKRIAELEAEIDRLKGNVIRNCVNWGPCSEHDGRMVGEGETTCGPAVDQIEADGQRIAELEAALKAISEDVHAPCVRLLIHPDMCKRAYQAKRALEGTGDD